MKIIPFTFALIACMGGRALADCEGPHALMFTGTQRLTEEAIAIRYRAFLAACTQAGGNLIDIESATYQGRISGAVLARVPVDDSYPLHLLRKGISGVVLVVGIVETTGKVSGVTLIGTSGHREFDDAALNSVRHTKYREPYTLDGVAVRSFKSFLIRYNTP